MCSQGGRCGDRAQRCYEQAQIEYPGACALTVALTTAVCMVTDLKAQMIEDGPVPASVVRVLDQVIAMLAP